MKISRDNYESFFLGYLDGTLSDPQISELENFLLSNPDLRNELEGMENAILVPENYIYPDKNLLYKTDTISKIHENNFEYYCAASIEGDLNSFQMTDLSSYLSQHPECEKELELYQKTILKPDLSLRYNNKTGLKKKIPFSASLIIYSTLSAAAAITLILFLMKTGKVVDKPGIVTAKTETSTEENFTYNESSEVAQFHLQDDADPGKIFPLAKHINIIPDQTLKEEIRIPPEKTHENIFENDVPVFAGTLKLPALKIEGARPDRIEREKINKRHEMQDNYEKNFITLSDLAKKFINSRLFDKEEEFPDLPDITLWDVATSGIDEINRVTGSSIILDKQPGNSGESSVITFDAGVIGFTRTIR